MSSSLTGNLGFTAGVSRGQLMTLLVIASKRGVPCSQTQVLYIWNLFSPVKGQYIFVGEFFIKEQHCQSYVKVRSYRGSTGGEGTGRVLQRPSVGLCRSNEDLGA